MAKPDKGFVSCFVALGSNLGDSVEYLHKAMSAIESHSEIKSLDAFPCLSKQAAWTTKPTRLP